MKKLIKKMLFLAVAFGAFGFVNLSWAAQESKANIVNIINPSKSVGIQIGDLLIREVEIEVLKPYQISKNAFPVKGANKDGIELNDIKLDSKDSDKKTTYKIKLSYQVFGYSAKPSVMQLPVEHIEVTGGPAAFSVDIPAWRFWYASLVPTGLKSAKDSIQPQHMPTLIDLHPHKTKLIVLIAMFMVGLIGLVYINADKQWLPFMNGDFAQAHRKIKKLNKNKAGEQKALLYMHQAFNGVNGANLFANDVSDFVSVNPAYASLKTEIIRFFERSNAALFSDQNANSEQLINELITLSKSLRNCERGVK
ncbi:MAG: nonribosomal peptide synthetase MxaA [Pseudomonadota bacterium]